MSLFLTYTILVDCDPTSIHAKEKTKFHWSRFRNSVSSSPECVQQHRERWLRLKKSVQIGIGSGLNLGCWWNSEFGSKPAKGKGGSKVKTLSKVKRRRLDLQLHQTGPWSGKSFISVASYLLVWVWTDLRCSQQSVPMHCWVQEKQSDWCQLGDLGSQEKMVKH